MEENEVDLRDYLNIMYKRKWIIILTTLVAMISAAILSFFILKPVYQAKALLAISKSPPIVAHKGMTVEEFINLRTLTPKTFSVETYIGFLKSSSLEGKVIDALNLRTESGEKLCPDELDKMMVAKTIAHTELIEIRVEHGEPKMAKEITNVWAQLFIEGIEESGIQSARNSESAIKSQFDIAKRELDKAEEDKKSFEERSKIPVLEREGRDKINKIAGFSARLSDIEQSLQTTKAEMKIWLPQLIENEIAAYESRLADIKIKRFLEEAKERELKKELEDQSKVIILHKSIMEDQYLNQLLANLTHKGPISLSNLRLKSEEINSLYLNLKQTLIDLNISENVLKEEAENLRTSIIEFKEILTGLLQKLSKNELDYLELISMVNSNLSRMRDVQLGSLRSSMSRELESKLVDATISIQSLMEERKQLRENITKYSKELDVLRTVLETQRLKLTNLGRTVNAVSLTYNMLSAKLEDARVAVAMEAGEVKIVSLASEPRSPIRPKKKVNVVISGILGLMVGFVCVAFVEYIEKR